MIVKQIELEGSGKGTSGWFPVKQANVSFDHPFNVVLEHALNIDFVNEAQGPGARVAVEMSVESARALVQTITEVLQRAELGGYLEELHTKGANHEAVARAAIYKPNPNTV